jgi:hypothetical protein
MRHMCSFAVALALAVMLGAGCGDDGSGPSQPPSVPTGLSAQGTLGEIELTWDASTGGGLTGYNVYRSTDGANFTLLTATPVSGLAYQDTDVDDGVYYSYRITAVGSGESDYSAIVRQMHGTRLLARYDSGCVLEAGALNPYVAEDSVVVAGGDLEIQSGASLYILDSAVVDIEVEPAGPSIDISVRGLLRVEASPAAPAKLTAHYTDGTLPDGMGYALEFFDETIDYDPGDGSGTLIQNCYIENLEQGDGAFLVRSCSPRFYNCKISSNKVTGGSYFTIRETTALIVEHCYIYRVTLKISTNLFGTGALITKNTCRDAYYSIYFSGPAGPFVVDPGQIAYNDFDGTVHGLYLFQVEAGNIELGNNYWDGGLPEIVPPDWPGTIVVTPTLAEPPADCGPTW